MCTAVYEYIFTVIKTYFKILYYFILFKNINLFKLNYIHLLTDFIKNVINQITSLEFEFVFSEMFFSWYYLVHSLRIITVLCSSEISLVQALT